MGCKWVFTVKYKADGTVERYKPRLVAKGFTQTYDIDYTETFAPLAKLNTIRVLLSLGANLDWPLHQFDIKNSFLNGELEEEVFMTLPPGFCKEEEETRVCKLKKSLYGLKQSPKAWFDRFAKVIKNQEYQQGQSDHTMFFKQSNDGRMTILIVYVDDIILTGDNTGKVERLKKVLATKFEVKDLGQIRYFLGMEVARSRKGISISQRKYVLDLLTETDMLGCKPNNTPIKARKMTKSDGKPVDRERYQRLVGRLIYLSHTRPNIAFVVSLVSRYMHSPKESHLEAMYKILKYLKGSPRKGLFFEKGDSKKKLLEELHIIVELPIKLYCDNKAAISISHNPIQHDKTKHIEVDRHFIKEKIEKGTICMTYIPTRGKLPDIFTKRTKVQNMEIGVSGMPPPTWWIAATSCLAAWRLLYKGAAARFPPFHLQQLGYYHLIYCLYGTVGPWVKAPNRHGVGPALGYESQKTRIVEGQQFISCERMDEEKQR
ncbi:Retrovirus-related Pol polyprotein from transposon RE1 [Vitis vinifera]|uniref:Retrovirus-related Pol polyprotein from transposon RE1 n=1 Tax=Vitis vinifera TaxID=29760 RepID=A0A438G329_VITVI|nr:Retrovirus-related Pol polyprotein from transposon RE1 [Vitis vinifera]